MTEIGSILSLTENAIQNYESSLKELEHLETSIKRNQDIYEQLNKDIALYEEVRVFLQELAEVTRKEIASGLESVVTLCLQAVFGPSMSFEIEIDTSRNNTIINFFVINTEGEQVVRDSPEDSMGGGVVDTVAIGLRFGLLKILNPEPIGPILLDEPAKMVSADLIDSIATLLQELTQLFEKQTILVTHHTSIMDRVDNAIYIEKINGISKVFSSRE